MAYKISYSCVACGACIDVCPVEAISANDIYVINSDVCIECGACSCACPLDAISFDSTTPSYTPSTLSKASNNTKSQALLKEDILKLGNVTITKDDVLAGLKLISEITGGIAVIGLATTIITSWIPALGIPISAGMAHQILQHIGRLYISLPADQRQVIAKCAKFFNGIID